MHVAKTTAKRMKAATARIRLATAMTSTATAARIRTATAARIRTATAARIKTAILSTAGRLSPPTHITEPPNSGTVYNRVQ